MDTQTKNTLAYMVLMLALGGTAWAVYDSYERIRSLHEEDQVITFGDGSTIAGESPAVVMTSLDRTINTHLFGVVPVKPEKVEIPEPKVVEAPKTKLNLRLTGIISGSESFPGFAMIEVSRNETTVVSVGGEIGKTGASLHTIHSDHVLIDHRGNIEKIELERLLLGGLSVASAGPVTVKELDLSAAELAALTQVSAPSEPRNDNQAQNGQATNIFTDQNNQSAESDPDVNQEVQSTGEVSESTNQ